MLQKGTTVGEELDLLPGVGELLPMSEAAKLVRAACSNTLRRWADPEIGYRPLVGAGRWSCSRPSG